MSIFPERWQGLLIPTHNIPKLYIKDGRTYETRTNKEVKTSFMTEKQKYIGAFLDGYFENSKLEYGIHYISKLNNATDIAKKKWKQYKKEKI